MRFRPQAGDDVGGDRRAARRVPGHGAPIHVTLLGGFSLVVDRRPVPLPLAGQRLVAFLALQRHPVLRAFAAGTLWPDSSEERAGASLRTALWKIGGMGIDLVETSKDGLGLAPNVATDYRDAVGQAEHLLAGGEPETSRDPARSLKEDLLPDWYEDWLALEREQFRQLRLHALEVLCQRLSEAGWHAMAVGAGLAAVAADPLRESSRRVLIAAYLAEGNLHDAVRQYRAFRELLYEELGAVPSPDLEALLRDRRGGVKV